MRNLFLMLLLAFSNSDLIGQINFIVTVAGSDTAGFSGDNESPIHARLNTPEFLCLDKLNNIYISDCGNNRVRKITEATQKIYTIAGKGTFGYSGDGNQATNAEFYVPEGIFVDTSGNVYIADAGNNRIRFINNSTGIISTIAGSGPTGIGNGGDSGDGGQATDAQLNIPVGLNVDKYNNIYICDYNNNKVRKIDALTGIITTIAGNGLSGYSGDGSIATNSRINGPCQVFADDIGYVFICDQWNHAIRKVDVNTNIITTIAGNGSAGYNGDGGPAKNAQLNQPGGIYVDKNENIYIAEYGDGVIRRIDGATGIISTVAGTGTRGYSGDGGPATAAELRCGDVFLDKNGVIYIADEDNNRVRIVYNTAMGVETSPRPSPEERVLYPNPATDELHIDNAAGCEVRVFDLLGVEVSSFVPLANRIRITIDKETISIKQLIPGTYLFRVIGTDGVVQNFRLVKE